MKKSMTWMEPGLLPLCRANGGGKIDDAPLPCRNQKAPIAHPNGEWDFVSMLRTEGRRAVSEFLDASGDDLGKRSTANLHVLLAEC